MSDGLIAGFERYRLPGHDGVTIDALVGGSGPPMLLLHGAPQTRVCWKAMAPVLAEHFTLVMPDLRGYGRSDKPQGGGDFSAYSKRTMALDQVNTMRSIGFDVFDVVGHDRGGRVAYRLALDHPERVRRLALLDIISTLDVHEAFDARSAHRLWHWTFQSQPEPIPERLISADAADFIERLMHLHAGEGFEFDQASMADYQACMNDPATVHGMCEDYRSGWFVDPFLDRADLGVRKILSPLLVLWGAASVASGGPLDKWRRWSDDVRGEPMLCGHFLPEEAPAETSSKLLSFFEAKR